MTDATTLKAAPIDAGVQRALLWSGPGLLFAIVLLGAVNKWIRPLSVGSVIDSGLLGLLFPIALVALLAVLAERLAGDERLPTWRRSLGATGAGLLGGVLLVGAWGKILDPQAFSVTITNEGLDVLLPASVVALLALGLEVALGVGLVLGLRSRWLLAVSGLLVAFFLALTGRAYLRFLDGVVVEDPSCGCFGNLIERTPAQAFWQDTFLLVPTLALAFLAVRRAPLPLKRMLVVAVVGALSLGFAAAAPSLPLDDLATRLRPGVAVGDLCGGNDEARVCLSSLSPGLLEGEHWVVIADLEDEAFIGQVPALNAWTQRQTGLHLEVVSAAAPEQITTFFWTHGPSFEIIEVPTPLLRPLYRTLPRSFRVVDGEVVETVAGLPAEMLAPF